MSETPEKSYDLFISYADADRAWVEGFLLDALASAGLRCYSEAAFALGVPRLAEFESGILRSKRILLVISPAYLASDLRQFVDLIAQTFGTETGTWPVIPLVLQAADLPPRLAALTGLDATRHDEREAVVSRLCVELQRPVPAPSARPSCPYPGMVPFHEADADRFFGREEEVGELVERLRLHPFLAVIGPSGSGKSSLVFAGLVPALRKSGLFGEGGWLVRSLRPGEEPLAALAGALGGAGGGVGDVADGDPARAVARALAGEPGARRLLVVVDQLEELFTLAQADVVSFQERLLRLSRLPGAFVVLTVRADFYASLMGSALWREVQAHRAEIAPLDERGLRQAVLGPADAVGVYVEAALVERLVADAGGEPGMLPFVQETLVLLWERLERRFLALHAYESIVLPRAAYRAPGSSSGGTGLQVAMARRADAALAELTEEQQQLARRIFLRLVQFGEGRADRRRQQPVAALSAAGIAPELLEQTLQHLARHRLLTLRGEGREGGRTADIAHEALIGGWPALRQWVDERREAEQARRRLEGKAAEWVRLGRGRGGLLDEAELPEAERWLGSPDAADLGYHEALVALVQASQKAIEQAGREKEAAQQRELEQAKDLAKARQREVEQAQKVVREQKRANRLLWRGVGAAAFLTLVAFIGAGVAWYYQRVAAKERGNALEQEHLAVEARDRAEEEKSKAEKLALKEADARRRADDEKRAAQEERDRAKKARHAIQLGAALRAWKQHDVAAAEQILREVDGPLQQTWEQRHVVGLCRAKALPLLGHTGLVLSVAFSPDGKRLASGSVNKTLKVWDAETGQEKLTLKGHTDAVSSVAFSPDGKRLASASGDKTLKVWDAETGQEKLTLKGHTSSLSRVAFSPGRKPLVSGRRDKTAKVCGSDANRQVSLEARPSHREAASQIFPARPR
jgi:hypothetical protein